MLVTTLLFAAQKYEKNIPAIEYENKRNHIIKTTLNYHVINVNLFQSNFEIFECSLFPSNMTFLLRVLFGSKLKAFFVNLLPSITNRA